MDIATEELCDHGVVDLGHDLRLPRSARINVTDWFGYNLTIQVEFDGSRYRCSTLTMRRGDGAELGPEGIPDLPIASLIKDGVYELAGALLGDRQSRAPGGPDEVALRNVARLYKLATAVGEPPRKTISEVYGIAISTAGRWIWLAREAEFLDKAPEGAGAGRPRLRVA